MKEFMHSSNFNIRETSRDYFTSSVEQRSDFASKDPGIKTAHMKYQSYNGSSAKRNDGVLLLWVFQVSEPWGLEGLPLQMDLLATHFEYLALH